MTALMMLLLVGVGVVVGWMLGYGVGHNHANLENQFERARMRTLLKLEREAAFREGQGFRAEREEYDLG